MFASSNQLSPQHQHQASATKQNDQENKRRHSEDLRSSSSEDTADSATEHDLASSRASLGGCPVMHKVTTVDKEDDPLANSLEGSMNYLFEQLQRSKENDGRHEDDDDDDSQSHGTAGSSTIINSEAARFRSLQVILDKFAEGCTCPVIMIDVRGIIRSVNQETLLLFGYKVRNDSFSIASLFQLIHVLLMDDLSLEENH
jgi:PAS domain-containing protein